MRQISMANFRTDKALAACAALKAEGKMNDVVPLGKIIGEVIKFKAGTHVDQTTGEVRESLVLLGDFEGVSYADPETVMQTGKCYLPRYFTETITAMLEKSGDDSVLFAVEIAIKPTTRQIPWEYALRPLIQRPAGSRLELLKKEMQDNGTLGNLPAPRLAADKAAQIAGEPAPAGVEADEKDVAPKQPATAAKPADKPAAGKKAAA